MEFKRRKQFLNVLLNIDETLNHIFFFYLGTPAPKVLFSIPVKAV